MDVISSHIPPWLKKPLLKGAAKAERVVEYWKAFPGPVLMVPLFDIFWKKTNLFFMHRPNKSFNPPNSICLNVVLLPVLAMRMLQACCGRPFALINHNHIRFTAEDS